MLTPDQLVQVIQALQQEIQLLRNWQTDLKAAAATPGTTFLTDDAPGH